MQHNRSAAVAKPSQFWSRRRQAFVRPERISLLGWSSGGIAALWAVRPNAAPRDGSADFERKVEQRGGFVYSDFRFLISDFQP